MQVDEAPALGVETEEYNGICLGFSCHNRLLGRLALVARRCGHRLWNLRCHLGEIVLWLGQGKLDRPAGVRVERLFFGFSLFWFVIIFCRRTLVIAADRVK